MTVWWPLALTVVLVAQGAYIIVRIQRIRSSMSAQTVTTAGFVRYEGQDPPPWDTQPCQIPRSWGRRKLRRVIRQQHQTIAWERWNMAKIIDDYGLL